MIFMFEAAGIAKKSENRTIEITQSISYINDHVANLAQF